MEVRSQGRPARGSGEVGRIRLLEMTRDALKSKPRVDIQRREIAIVAGVTPALISYYYPDKWDLFAAAAKPVVESYTSRLRAILNSGETARPKILSITTLFIDFNSQQGYLLDFYLENSARMARQDDLRQLQEVYKELLCFFESLIQDGHVQGESPEFIQTSLWGLCKHIAQQPHLANLSQSPEKDHVLRSQARKVCDLFLGGIATSSLLTPAGAEQQATPA